METKCEDHLEAARAAMTTLAHAYRPRELAAEAFALDEAFRPAVPESRSAEERLQGGEGLRLQGRTAGGEVREGLLGGLRR